MSNICILILMRTSETETKVSRIPVDLPLAEKTEFTRLARSKYDRGAGPMVRQLIRDFIAAEQAAEAAEAAEGQAAA